MHNPDIQHRSIFLLKMFGVAALYALLIFLDHRYFESGTVVSPFEAASGFALAVLLIGGRRYVWGVLLGAFLVNVATAPFVKAIAISSGAALEVFCGAWLLTRDSKIDLKIRSLRDYLRLLLLGGLAGVGIGANVGTSALVISGFVTPEDFLRELAHWWTGDILGVILVAPLILVCWHNKNEWLGKKRVTEAALLLGLTFMAGQIIFLDWFHSRTGLVEEIAKGYWMFLFIFWVAVRLGTRGTVIAINIAAIQGLLGAYQGAGFFGHDIELTQLANYWCFTVILSVVGMALATYFTEIRLSNEILRHSETRLRTLYDSTSDAVMLLDEKGFFDCNRATLAMFGCATKKEFCSKHPADLSPPVQPCGTDSMTLANQKIATAMEKGHHQFEWRHKRADTGKAFPADVLLNSMALDGKTVLQATVRDITESKKAENALKLKNFVFDESIAANSIADLDGVITETNEMFLKVWGYPSKDEVVGKPIPHFLNDPNNAAAIVTALDRAGQWEGDYVAKRKDGSTFLAHGLATTVQDENGKLIGYQSAVLDITERKNAENKLRESEEMLRHAQSIAKVGHFKFNPFTGVVDGSDELFRIFGLTREEFQFSDFVNSVHPDDRALDVATIESAIERKTGYKIEHRLLLRDGTIKWVKAIGEFVSAVPEEQSLLIGTVQDISERKQADETLRKLSLAVEQSPNSIVITDLDANIEYVNQAFIKETGYSFDEAVGQNPRLLSSGKNWKGVYEEMWVCLKRGEAWKGELVNRRKDGSEYIESALISPVCQADGRATHYLAIKENITRRKNNELKIERLSRIYLLLSRVNEAIVRTQDRNELFTAVCNAAVVSELFRFVWIGLLDEQRLAVIPSGYAGVEEGYMDEVKIRLDDERTGNGPIGRAIRANTPVLIQDIENDPSMLPWRDEAMRRGYRASAAFPLHVSGNVIGTINVYAVEAYFFTPDIAQLMLELAADVSFALDVLAEKKRRELAEDEIIKLNVELEHRVMERTCQLEAANKELEAFSYSVSHDLRAPLRSIDGFSRVLFKKYHAQLDATGQDWLERVCRASQHMGHLIDDMLKLSLVASGPLRRERTDLSGIAETVADNLRKAYPEREVRFIIQQELLAQADPGLLRIAMNNLLGNAFKFTGKKAEAEIEFGACDVEGGSAYFVRDNGDGFNMEYAHKLFGTFQRLHTMNEFEGTGIGLATVQRIILRHHGKVWADAKEGQGATFYFTLPQRERGGGLDEQEEVK